MKKEKKNTLKLIVLALVLFLSIGYASLSITLNINGEVNLIANLEDYDVYIGNLYLNNINKHNEIANDLKSITIEVEPGENNVDIYIANNATEYDEKVEIKCNTVDGISYEYTLSNEGTIYAQQIEKEIIKVTNEASIRKTITCSIENEEQEKTEKVTKVKKVFFASEGFENETPYKIITGDIYGELPIISLKKYEELLGWFNKDEIKIEETTNVENLDDEVLTLSIENECLLKEGKVYNFSYNGIDGTDGSEQTFTTECPGEYKLETWGASGTGYGGAGGYSKGNILFKEDEKLFIYVGGQSIASKYYIGGYNGGGYGTTYGETSGYTVHSYSGGGSTDVRLVDGIWNNFDSLKSRIMVASGGAGEQYNNKLGVIESIPGYGGGLNGGNAGGPLYLTFSQPPGATQTSTGISGTDYIDYYGAFGMASQTSPVNCWGSGAGSGYYGGTGGCGAAGSGGSSFISGHKGCNAIAETSTNSNVIHTGNSIHYSKYVFTNTKMIDGGGYNWTNVKGEYIGQPQPDGTISVGHQGHGYARITFEKYEEPEEATYLLILDKNYEDSDLTFLSIKNGEKYTSLDSIDRNENYEFLGWYTEKDGGTRIQTGDVFNLKENQILYAHWKLLYSTVTYDYNIPKNYADGNDSSWTITKSSFSNTTNDCVTALGIKDISETSLGDILSFSIRVDGQNLVADTLQYHRFRFQYPGDVVGWGAGSIYSDDYRDTGSFSKTVTFDRIVDGNINKNSNYSGSVRFDYYVSGSATFSNYIISLRHKETKKYNVLTETATFPTKTISGYNFLGWYIEKEGGTQVTSSNIFTSDNVTIYGHWEKV